MNSSAKTATVKWFNPIKGFGFLQPEEGGDDIFVHKTALEDSKIYELHEGQKIEYNEATDRGKTKAVNLKII